MNVERQRDVLLPVHNPEARKDQEKKNEPEIGDDRTKITSGLGYGGRLLSIRAPRFAEKNEHGENHQQNAKRRHSKNIFDAQVAMHPRRDERSGSAADVYQRVVNRIADAAYIFFGRTSRCADHTRFHQRHAESRQHQDEEDKNAKRRSVAYRRHPGRADRSEQKIRRSQNKVSDGKRAAETKFIGDGAANNREKPNHATEKSGEAGCFFRGKMKATRVDNSRAMRRRRSRKAAQKVR